jgi:DNA-binding PadR family transcriptional regulator
MDYDPGKIKEAVLALLYLWSWQEEYGIHRTWKEMDWDVLDSLHEQGYISNPKGNRKSVTLTEEGIAQAQEFAAKYFSPPA